ncbi:UNVERIFIED_CONTAM: hypothetical protein NCL1_44724 [Trichonephila clavipes]
MCTKTTHYDIEGNWNSDDIDVETLFCTLAAILFSLVNYPVNQISGARVIYDAKNSLFKQMRAFIPKYLTFITKALRSLYPLTFCKKIESNFLFRFKEG